VFGKLRDALDRALSGLESRMDADPGEEIARLLAEMRDELIEAKARLPELEKQIRTLEAARAEEEKSAEDSARRARQAMAIDDRETVEVALRFEARHRARSGVLKQKIEAAEAELALQRQTVTEMTAQLKEAIARRESLRVRARRARGAERVRGAGYSSVDEFERLAEEIERGGDVDSALREVDQELESGGEDRGASGTAGEPLDREELAELQLRELKRRMAEGKEGSEK
jgi:phage shock protein A